MIAAERVNPKEQTDGKIPAPTEGIAITHFIVSRDVERSRRFYVEVLGGRLKLRRRPASEARGGQFPVTSETRRKVRR